MSVCAHDSACPGYGPRHDQQLPPVFPRPTGRTEIPMSNKTAKRIARALRKARREGRIQ